MAQRVPPPPPHHPGPIHVQPAFEPLMAGALPTGGEAGGGRGGRAHLPPQQGPRQNMMAATGGGQHHPQGMPDLLGRVANMHLNGGQPHGGPEQDKSKAKPSPPKEKPGTIVAYEGYTFDRLDGWAVASKRPIRVSEGDIEEKVNTKKTGASIIDVMSKMSAGRRAQIDRLIDEKKQDEKEPQWYEWTPVGIEEVKSRTVKRGKKDVKEVLSMDVFMVRKVRKGVSDQKPEKPKDDKGNGGVLGGTIVDVRQPLKPKEKSKEAPKPKEHSPGHEAMLPQLGHLDGIHEPPMDILNGHGGGHQGGPFPGHGGHFHGGAIPIHHDGGGGGGHHEGAADEHGVVVLNSPGNGHGGGHGGLGGQGGQPRRRPSNRKRVSESTNHSGVRVIQDDHPPTSMAGMAHAGQGGHGHPDPFSAPIPGLPGGGQPLGENLGGKFIPDDEGSQGEEGELSPFDDDGRSSATSLYSVEHPEKPVPRRGSLKISRRRSKGGDVRLYREHKREKNYRDAPRRRDFRFEDEVFDVYPERPRRPHVDRRSTIAYVPGPRRITYPESPPLSPRGHSPMRRSSGLTYPDELDRYRAKERDAEEYLRQREEDEDYRRAYLARERERQKRAEEDILDRMTLRSDPIGRYGYR